MYVYIYIYVCVCVNNLVLCAPFQSNFCYTPKTIIVIIVFPYLLFCMPNCGDFFFPTAGCL